MRNLLTPPTDRRFIPRKPRGGYHWLNLFGKDWVVKRRKATWTGIIGTSLSIAGVIGVAWGSIERFNPVAVGIMLVLVGVFLICYKKLETKNLAADEIYRVGYDRGKEDGYDEGYEDSSEDSSDDGSDDG